MNLVLMMMNKSPTGVKHATMYGSECFLPDTWRLPELRIGAEHASQSIRRFIQQKRSISLHFCDEREGLFTEM